MDIRGTFIEKIVSMEWSVGTVKEAAGMSYRKVNDWESKNYIDTERPSERNWRKFNVKEIFGLQLCGKLGSLGIKAQNLPWLIQEIKTKTCLEYALYLYLSGVKVYFSSDLKEKLSIQGEMDFQDSQLVLQGSETPFINFYLNPILDKLMAVLKLPPVPSDKSIKQFLSGQEQSLVKAMRTGRFDKINLKKKEKSWHMEGEKYYQRGMSKEISNQREKPVASKTVTYRDKYGKITSGSITEDIG